MPQLDSSGFLGSPSYSAGLEAVIVLAVVMEVSDFYPGVPALDMQTYRSLSSPFACESVSRVYRG